MAVPPLPPGDLRKSVPLRLTLVFQARRPAAGVQGPEALQSLDERERFWWAVLPEARYAGSAVAASAPGSSTWIEDLERKVEDELGAKLEHLLARTFDLHADSGVVSSHQELPRLNIVARIRGYSSLEVALTVFGLSEFARFVGAHGDAILTVIELCAPQALAQSVGAASLPVSATLSSASPVPPVALSQADRVQRILHGTNWSIAVPALLALVIAYVWFAASHDEVERARAMQRDLTTQQRLLIDRLLGTGDALANRPRAGAATERPDGPTSGSSNAVTAVIPPGPPVQGTVALRLPRYLGAMGLVVALGGVPLWLMGTTRTAKAAAGALFTIGSLTSAASLIRELKVDSLFSIESVPITITLPKSMTTPGGSGAQLLGSIDGFGLASATLDDTNTRAAADIAAIKGEWARNRQAGKTGILLLVGSADRLPLRQAALQRFESNFGLARARAEAVKASLQRAFKELPSTQGVDDRQILVLVSGPRSTPDARGDLAGYPDDRRVDVWAVWGWESSASDARR
jgi:hypothetical protein